MSSSNPEKEIVLTNCPTFFISGVFTPMELFFPKNTWRFSVVRVRFGEWEPKLFRVSKRREMEIEEIKKDFNGRA